MTATQIFVEQENAFIQILGRIVGLTITQAAKLTALTRETTIATQKSTAKTAIVTNKQLFATKTGLALVGATA